MKNNQVNRIFLRESFLEADGKSEPAAKSIKPRKKSFCACSKTQTRSEVVLLDADHEERGL